MHRRFVPLAICLMLYPTVALHAQQRRERETPRSITRDGIRAEYFALEGGHIKLRLSRAGSLLGTVEYLRTDSEILTTFNAPDGNASFRDVREEAKASEALYLYWNNKEIPLTGADVNEADIQTAFQEIANASGLQELLRVMPEFLNESVIRPIATTSIIVPEGDDGLECAEKILACIGAAALYVGGIAGLITVCGFSLGLSCVIAILAHPVLSLTVGAICTQALKKCGLQ
jgi:hypothetical protein